jgi:hypothetical protein
MFVVQLTKPIGAILALNNLAYLATLLLCFFQKWAHND